MKTVPVEKANLRTCVSQAQSDRVVLTQEGVPVALLIGVEGLDREQIALGASERFWKLIGERRAEPTISRAALEARIDRASRSRRKQ